MRYRVLAVTSKCRMKATKRGFEVEREEEGQGEEDIEDIKEDEGREEEGV